MSRIKIFKKTFLLGVFSLSTKAVASENLQKFSLTATSNEMVNNYCDKYENKTNYMQALKVIATSRNLTVLQLCQHEGLLDIYATPSRIVTRDGEVIPHTRVEFIYAYSTCKYMVSDVTNTISNERCYSTW